LREGFHRIDGLADDNGLHHTHELDAAAAAWQEQIMTDRRTIDELRNLGSGYPAPDDVVRLYRQAFADFGARALWSSRAVEHPTVAAALGITESLRVEGNLEARRLAERIEQACRAAL
jgi:hypothetical protein